MSRSIVFFMVESDWSILKTEKGVSMLHMLKNDTCFGLLLRIGTFSEATFVELL